ncbi:MAG: hypothetical protein IJ260_11410 [Butyrivibrio sp.]|nr:hypothetical protein [Butyrivibrio sp.]
MKKMIIEKITLGITVVSMVAILSGCGSHKEEWAYSHDPAEPVITLSDNGRCTYKGNEYTYSQDDTFITLKNDKGETIKMRYQMDGDQMTLYEESTYERFGEDTDSVVGTWKQDNGWSYQYLPKGEFAEENNFHGHYSVEEDKSCIKLMSDDPIEDAYLYYALNDNELTVAYPWPMVKVK